MYGYIRASSLSKHVLSPTFSFCFGTPGIGTGTDSSHHGQMLAALGSRSFSESEAQPGRATCPRSDLTEEGENLVFSAFLGMREWTGRAGAVDVGLASIRKASCLWRTRSLNRNRPFWRLQMTAPSRVLHGVPWIPRAASDLSVKLTLTQSGDTKMWILWGLWLQTCGRSKASVGSCPQWEKSLAFCFPISHNTMDSCPHREEEESGVKWDSHLPSTCYVPGMWFYTKIWKA